MIETIVERVFILDGGRLNVEASMLNAGNNFGVRVDVPVPLYLVQTRLGHILIDAGNDPGVIEDPVGTWGEQLVASVRPTMTAENHPSAQLAKVGVEMKDIKVVIYTHLHHDHAGGARLFPQATHVLQTSEYRWAYHPDSYTKHIYLRSDFDHPQLKWMLVHGDVALFPGVQLIHTPGHTPGHQAVVLWDVPGVGTVILSGDGINTRENVRLDVPPGIATSSVDAMAAIHRLTAIAATHDATLIPNHDLEFWGLLAKAPKALNRPSIAERRFWLDGVREIYGERLSAEALMK